MSEHTRPLRMKERRLRRASLYGWMLFIPVFAPPFYVVYCEITLNTRTVNHDYEAIEINREIRELQSMLSDLGVEQARLENVEQLENKAPDLGLVEAAPSQLDTVYVDSSGGDVVFAAPEIVAAGDVPEGAFSEPVPLPIVTEAPKELPKGLGALPPVPAPPQPGAPGTVAQMAQGPVRTAGTIDTSEELLLGAL